MTRTYSAQKAGLTRALNSKNPRKIRAELLRTRQEWDSRDGQFTHGWPDDWHRWNVACRDWAGCELDDLNA